MKNAGKHGDDGDDAGLSGFQQQAGDSLFEPVAISVPFKWEEAPGKPKATLIDNTSGNSPNYEGLMALQLPPRLQGSPNSALPPPPPSRRSITSSSSCCHHHHLRHLRDDQIGKVDGGGGSRPSAFLQCFKSFVKVWRCIRKSRSSTHQQATSMDQMWSPTLATYLYNNAKAMQQEEPPSSSANNFTIDSGRLRSRAFLLQLHEDEYHQRASLQQLLAAEDDAEPWHNIEKQAWPWKKVQKNLVTMMKEFLVDSNAHG